VTRIGVLIGMTLREAARKRYLWIIFAAGLLFLVLFGTALHFQIASFDERHVPALIRRQAFSAILMLGLYAIDMLIVVTSVLTSVDTLSGEIASGAIQGVVTKPLSRWQLLTGKWLGFASMLTVYLLMMVGGINVLTNLMTGVTVHHIVRGFALMWMESILLLSVTFYFGTAYSTLTNGVLVLGLHGLAFIGGWVEQAGALTQTPKAVEVGILASLLMPSEALWRKAAIEMQPPIATALQLSPFSGSSVPSATMVTYAAIYICVAFALALRRLAKRDL
jgi:ABC-2 type transport system permease protein